LHGELEAISLVPQQLIYRLQAFEKVVILMDSKAAIQAASSNSQSKSKKINNIKEALKHLQAFKKIVIFQGVPSFFGPEGNKISDKLAKKGTTLHAIRTPLQTDTMKKLLNHKIAMRYKQETDELAATKKWRDIHKIWANLRRKQ